MSVINETVQNTKQEKEFWQIVVRKDTYNDLRDLGKTTDSMNDVVSMLVEFFKNK